MDVTAIENELLGDASVYDSYGKYVEDKFQRMKLLASQAGWPSSLTPEIVAIDKEWQKVKEDANAKKQSTAATAPPVLAKITTMSSRLEAYIKNRKPSEVLAPYDPRAPTPTASPAVSDSSAPASSESDAPTPAVAPSSDWLDVFKRQYGPLPLWGWGAAGAGVFVAAYFLIPRRK